MRRARIALLKATHFPYIATIWAYEGANRYFASSGENGQYVSKSDKSPLNEAHLNPAHQASRYSASRTKSDTFLLCKTPGSEERAAGTRDLESITEMKRMIEQLILQVEELSQKLSNPVDEMTKA